MAANKLDYSRLLDDEFLNRSPHPERGPGRCRAVSRGAAEVLGLQADLHAGSLRSRVSTFLYGAAMAAAVLISIIFALLLVHAHQQGVQRLHALRLPFAQRLAMGHETLPDTSPAAVHSEADDPDYDHGHVHEHAYDHEHDGDHDHELHGAADETAHHIALAGGFEATDEEHEHPHGMHEHVNPGDVVMEDHHIVPAATRALFEGDPESTPHVLLLCLPLPVKVPAQANETAAGSESSVRLSRAQRDVAHSVAEYLTETAQCYLIALRGVGAGEQANATAASTGAAPGNRTAPLFLGFSTGCGSPEDASDELDGAEAGGDFVLSTGRRLPVVFWDAGALFARSPLTAVWRGLGARRAAGSTAGGASSSTSTVAAAGPDLLGVAARLQLLWRYGGLSVDLNISADRALKVLSAYNRTDTAHVYLETTRAVLLAAPQTCNAVVFDLISAITKQSRAADGQGDTAAPDAQRMEHYDEQDVKVFDGVLNEYCRGSRGRRARSAASVTSGTTTTESYTTPEETPSSTATSTAAPAPSTRPPPVHAKATFNMLRAGPPVPSTTPQPLDIRVDTTHCKGNLVAISLA
ncbi:C2 calcium-dependent domain-containing protein 4B [Frankliniella fusca]|uniref:C2 calcium-dependent domain-containing protein 4B n=1 Tax=Frankliniella fusca TaxID=407009 RepID=A0AAE1I080_9NEOP|nr:C2 calcium-dependent domain-containing protein 4B [Frankliniella fusca]